MRVWVGRLLPWAAFVVAVVFAFAQLAQRNAAARTSASDTPQSGAEAADATPPAPAPLDLSLPPWPDHQTAEHRDALLAVTQARLAAHVEAARAVPAPAPPVEAKPVPAPAPEAPAARAADVARRAAALSPLEIRALALRLETQPELVHEARALVPWLPPSRDRERLVAALAALEASDAAGR
ncbi:MAG: hypothetical protein QNJ98_17495 [Planctomycetota bacterium]|nr:hypothetical protein [Planctomycetota bacterium]